MIFKYEEIIKSDSLAIESLINFCELNPKFINFKTINNLPLRGSSTYRGDCKKTLHWDKIEKPENFRPTGRWSEWSWLKKETFKIICGSTLKKLQYIDNDKW